MLLKANKALNDRRKGIKREEGFTLIELLVVVIIIGILAAIAIPIYIGVQNSSKDAAVKTDLGNAKIAVIAWGTDHPGTTGPTLDKATLGTIGAGTNYGFTQSEYTSVGGVITAATTLAFGTTAVWPAFCIDAPSISDPSGTSYMVTDAAGVTKGTCP